MISVCPVLVPHHRYHDLGVQALGPHPPDLTWAVTCFHVAAHHSRCGCAGSSGSERAFKQRVSSARLRTGVAPRSINN
jgi:hypothetical protein